MYLLLLLWLLLEMSLILVLLLLLPDRLPTKLIILWMMSAPGGVQMMDAHGYQIASNELF
jgi:hypothetical protein